MTPAMPVKRVRFGRVHADDVTFNGAVDAIEHLVERGQGGYVLTPNVDHVVLAETNADLVQAYQHASLSVVDGMPLVWLARLMGHPLPDKISGSDLVGPVVARAATRGWRVYFLGAAPGVGRQAADNLLRAYPGFEVAGVSSPPLGFEKDEARLATVLEEVAATSPHVVLVALGCPKQELLMARCRERLRPAVMLGIGATLDFLAGRVRRAPPWVSKIGAEWLYRILQDPRRLAHRYFVRDRAILGVAWRMLRMPRAQRAQLIEGP